MLTFPTEKVNSHITRIFGFGTELMYLVEGSEYAVLLDTGSGFGSLKACTDQLTDKPIKVLITHGHVDHALGAAEYQNVYMNHEDDVIFTRHSDKQFRLDGLSMYTCKDEFTMTDLIEPMPLSEMKDMKEGDAFDLGGIHIDVYACPGHTVGSLIFLIREDGILLTGDACNPFTFLFEDYSTSVDTYLHSLKKLKEKTDGKYSMIMLSHGTGEGYPELINDVIQVCINIEEGKTDDIPMEFKGHHGLIAMKDPDMKYGNIVYRKDKIWD